MGTLICLLCKSRMEPEESATILCFKDGLFLGRACKCSNIFVKLSSNKKTFLEAFELLQTYKELNEVLMERR